MLLIALLLALPFAAWAGDEGTFTPTADSMGLKPATDWLDLHVKRPDGPSAPVSLAMGPARDGRSLQLVWDVPGRDLLRIEVRIDGKLRGTQTWDPPYLFHRGCYTFEPELPLKEPHVVELTAWAAGWYAERKDYLVPRKLPSVSLNTANLRPPRFSLGGPHVGPNQYHPGTVLGLTPSRAWVQLSINGGPPQPTGLDWYPARFVEGKLELLPNTNYTELPLHDVLPWHYVNVRAWDPYFGGEKETELLLWPEPPARSLQALVVGFGPMALLLLTLVLLTRWIARHPMSDSPKLGWTSYLPLGGWALARRGRWTLAWLFGLLPAIAGLVVLPEIGIGWRMPLGPPSLALKIVVAAWLASAVLGFALARWLGPVKTPPRPLRPQKGLAESAQLVGCLAGLLLPGLAQLGQRRGPASWRFVVLACWLYFASWIPGVASDSLGWADGALPVLARQVVGLLLVAALLAAVVGSVFEANRAAWRIRDAEVAAQPAPEGGAQAGPNPSS